MHHTTIEYINTNITILLSVLHVMQETSSIDSDLDGILFGVMHKMQESEQQSEEYALFSTILMLVKKIPMPTECSCRWLQGELEKVIGHHITSKCV